MSLSDKNTTWGLAALAVAVAAAGFWLGQGLERFGMANRSVTVKGLAEQTVESDFAVWSLGYRRAANEFATVQQQLQADREKVLEFLRQQGFASREIEVRPLQVQDLLTREYAQEQVPLRFTGSGQIFVKSSRVDAVAKAALAVDPLIQVGVQLGAEGEGGGGPEYQLRGFDQFKTALLAQATQNARGQAQKFAAESGAALGLLKTANQGIIGISSDDGGDYDNSHSRMKRLRVVSTFTYELR